jgi:hypothetical protein
MTCSFLAYKLLALSQAVPLRLLSSASMSNPLAVSKVARAAITRPLQHFLLAPLVLLGAV